jgi:hypothetical protein
LTEKNPVELDNLWRRTSLGKLCDMSGAPMILTEDIEAIYTWAKDEIELEALDRQRFFCYFLISMNSPETGR